MPPDFRTRHRSTNVPGNESPKRREAS
jgi:hypothetical protein